KIERWHQTLKNRILLENYFLPGDLEAQIAALVDDYNHRRYHESIGNLTPADVYCGRGPTILAERERIKRQTINSSSQNRHSVAQPAATPSLRSRTTTRKSAFCFRPSETGAPVSLATRKCRRQAA